MLPLTIGVVVSPGPSRRTSSAAPRPFDRMLRAHDIAEQEIDLRSASDLEHAVAFLGHRTVRISADGDLESKLRRNRTDACLLALHGRLGGTGRVHARIAGMGIPFAGAPVAAVTLAFDKWLCRKRLAEHAMPTPASLLLGPGSIPTDQDLELLGWPCFVKPRRGAHGFGVSSLTNVSTMADEIRSALGSGTEVVLERATDGREIQVALLGTHVLGSLERVPSGVTPISPLSRLRLEGIHTLARRAVEALGLQRGLSRVDVLVDDRWNEWVLEVEPAPSLARLGVVARIAANGGWTYERLIDSMLSAVQPRLPRQAALASQQYLQ